MTPHTQLPSLLTLALALSLAACTTDARGYDTPPPEGFDPDRRNNASPDPTPDPEPTPTPDPDPDPQPTPDPEPVAMETGAECTDGEDNDGDNFADCRDFDCAEVLPCTLPEDTEATCSDGIDNDADRFTDCDDFDCEATAACAPAEDDLDACTDGLDNDNDDLVDCGDTDCEGVGPCALPEDNTEACTDGLDNDNDSYVDCVDFDCDEVEVCRREDRQDTCTDERDNDGDGRIDCEDPDCSAIPACDPNRLRVLSYNVQDIGRPGSPQYNALVAVFRRLSPHIACLQEVDEDEQGELERFAEDLGYEHLFQGLVTTRMAGGLTNACLSRLPIIDSASLSSSEIASDTSANETGRDIVQIRVEGDRGIRIGLFVVHLKSGFEEADQFRRTVEALRLGEAIAEYRRRNPNDAILAMGDFNERIDSFSLGDTIRSAPEGLPNSYNLGDDLGFPFEYDPFGPLEDQGLTVAEASQEDSTSLFGTRIPSSRRIDYVYFRGVTLLGDEVYDTCRDNGFDDPPEGQYIDKFGSPLGCGVGEQASDHRPVVVDITLR